jgi:hypothetical protein
MDRTFVAERGKELMRRAIEPQLALAKEHLVKLTPTNR